jgi:hypothetical protein
LTYTHQDGVITLPKYITEHQSLAGYATELYVKNAIAEAELAGKEVDLSGYATKDFVTEEINKIEIPEAYNDTELRNLINGKAASDHTHEGYAKTADLFSKDYNDLTNKPEIPSIEGLASEDYVQAEIGKIKLPETDLSNYYDKEEVDSLIENIEHPTVSLDGYATEKYVDDAIAAIQEPVEQVKTTLTTTVLPKVEKVDEIEPTVSELKAWVDNKNYLQDIDLSKVEEDLRVLENNIGYVKVDDKSFAEVIDETFAKKTDIPTKVSELENDTNYTNETKVLELIENNANTKIGIDFVTDITVGHLKSGTFISKDKTLQEILYNILVCNHD